MRMKLSHTFFSLLILVLVPSVVLVSVIDSVAVKSVILTIEMGLGWNWPYICDAFVRWVRS